MRRLMAFPDRCTGCRICESVCSLFNDRAVRPFRSRVKVVKLRDGLSNMPVLCLQCLKAPCAERCPAKAISRRGDALVIDREACIGCGVCVTACPFGAITMVDGEPLKCELCGGDPVCVKYCAAKALQFIELPKASEARQLEHALKALKAGG
jgi:Fe-S-cluster-containing hydrogenase component 2